MLGRIRPHLTYANVMVTLLAFIVLGGVAYAGATITGDDVVDGSLTAADYKNNDIRGLDVRNFSLNDEDISQGTFVDFPATIGTVAAQQCDDFQISGVNAAIGDHLVLTPDNVSSDPNLIYYVEYGLAGNAVLVVCNPATFAINDGTTHFSLLVIDAR